MNPKVLAAAFVLFLLATPGVLLAQTSSEAPLWQLRDYTSARISSSDTTGANDDGNWQDKIEPGETRTIAEVEGPGIIKHIWTTIASNERFHLKKIVLRMYWDGEDTPSVETPVGDFFGLGLGRYHLYESEFLSVGSQRALNASFPMPFRESAKITVTNEGAQAINAYYYNIDWEKHRSLPEDLGYFHAQYRQAVPTDGWTSDWDFNGDPKINNKQNKTGEGNYVFMEAEGRGHFVGVTHSIIQNQGDWWGEGDEMFFIDGADAPQINGTGAEDYYLGAWCYGGCGINPFGNQQPTFDYDKYGNPLNGGDHRGAEWTVYRFHTDAPIVFEESLRATIEHGHANRQLLHRRLLVPDGAARAVPRAAGGRGARAADGQHRRAYGGQIAAKEKGLQPHRAGARCFTARGKLFRLHTSLYCFLKKSADDGVGVEDETPTAQLECRLEFQA